MGGGNEAIVCQMCDVEGHSACECQWVYSKCKNCEGLMIMHIYKPNEGCGKKYLKCQFPSCGSRLWLEDAMKEAAGSTSNSTSCFQCGQNNHWVKDCPWRQTMCPNGCEGSRKILTSKQTHSFGKKILKCFKCDSFEWLEKAMSKSSKKNIRVKIEVNLDDLCNSYESKMHV